VLRYDSEERHFAASVDALTDAAEIDREEGVTRPVPDPAFLGARYADGRAAGPGDRLVPVRDPGPGRPLVYGRSARDRQGRLWLQYWLFFADNRQDRGILRTGRHTGDWELLQLRLGLVNRRDVLRRPRVVRRSRARRRRRAREPEECEARQGSRHHLAHAHESPW
jgi:hypothetical protein